MQIPRDAGLEQEDSGALIAPLIQGDHPDGWSSAACLSDQRDPFTRGEVDECDIRPQVQESLEDALHRVVAEVCDNEIRGLECKGKSFAVMAGKNREPYGGWLRRRWPDRSRDSRSGHSTPTIQSPNDDEPWLGSAGGQMLWGEGGNAWGALLG